MISQVIFTLALVAVAASQDNRPDWRHNRPTPPANANPHDTNNVRLVGKRFEYAEVPRQVDSSDGDRGKQAGYNICNNSTGGPNSMCQTIIVNSIEDFCFFMPPTVKVVGDAEGEMVAVCTTDKHGTRVLPPGALTAVQFLKTPSYIGIAALINQTLLNMPVGDYGGELDSGGQDQRGNPIGGVAFSEQLPFSKGVIKQAPTWTQFIGNNVLCMKLCDMNAPNAMNLCEHVYDTIGCEMNFPAAYAENVFESCDSEDQHPVGELAFSSTVILPKTSNCVAHQSAELYPNGGGAPPQPTTTPGPSTPSPTGSTPQNPTTTPGSPNTPRPNPATSTTTKSPAPSSSSPPDAALSRVEFSGLAVLIPVFAGVFGAYFV